ncbi:uncharacterized protein LOC114342414 isoform X2 [Diabrotica virgifera virgifera]|uniref:27 kDa hemolymph protein-like n=1 Tax=Diabrotica virgifera virgifera TaxID=50390 RepID=A0ABM5KB86_DIAVI|nr:uncharacterized protein LOC114342414 isoform X2 [Diabrotica virgifera virgifera]
MKWILLTVVIVLGLTNAEEVPEGRAALRKTTRQSLGSIGGLFFGNSEKDIIIGCMKNGLSKSGADKLQATYDKVYSCMSDTRIFETPENEFISKVEKCSRDAINESKACLPRNQTYYPEFFLDFTKSLIRHKYDHKDLLTNFSSQQINVSQTPLNSTVKLLRTSTSSSTTTILPSSIYVKIEQSCKRI